MGGWKEGGGGGCVGGPTGPCQGMADIHSLHGASKLGVRLPLWRCQEWVGGKGQGKASTECLTNGATVFCAPNASSLLHRYLAPRKQSSFNSGSRLTVLILRNSLSDLSRRRMPWASGSWDPLDAIGLIFVCPAPHCQKHLHVQLMPKLGSDLEQQ